MRVFDSVLLIRSLIQAGHVKPHTISFLPVPFSPMMIAGELENHGSTRDFTNEGQPIREGMLLSRFTKVGNFEPVEVQDGVDLLKSLNNYLRAHTMSRLVRTGAAL